MSNGRVCETERPDVNGSAYECTCEWARRAKQGGTAGSLSPVPAEMQGQVFCLYTVPKMTHIYRDSTYYFTVETII